VPDGAAVDTEGGYWCALHGGSRLRRYTPEGALDAEIMLPVSQPTMCAFGGEALDVLYITSARQKLGPAQLAREPLAGSILSLRCGKRGVERHCTVR
jgi:sugar lactone lactonase YvrE